MTTVIISGRVVTGLATGPDGYEPVIVIDGEGRRIYPPQRVPPQRTEPAVVARLEPLPVDFDNLPPVNRLQRRRAAAIARRARA